MSKKEIWILNHYAGIPSEGGWTRHYDFACELTKRGYNVSIFASSYNHATKLDRLKENERQKAEYIRGIRFIWIKTIPSYKGNGVKRILNMVSYMIKMIKLYKIFGRPDVVIGSSVHLFACLSAYYIAKRTKARFICEIRDLWPQTLIDMKAISYYHPLAVFFRGIEKFIYRKAEKIIVLLPGAKDYINKFIKDENKIVYLPNGVNAENFDKYINNEEMPIPEGIKNAVKNKFSCIYAGAHGSANCLETIVHAALILQQRKYEDIVFLLIGDGPEKNKLIDYCRKNKVNNILFFDPVSKESISGILKLADIGMVSMKNIELYRYGISLNKLFDYMYSGRPVVFAGDVCNDIIKESGGGITVAPENPEAFADAVTSLYKMTKEERENIGNKGRKYVEENHNISRLADSLEKLFN